MEDSRTTIEFERVELPIEVEESFEDITLVYSDETARLVQHLARNPHLWCRDDEVSRVFFELLDTSISEDRKSQEGV